jgi:hypothetical protein
MSIMLTNFLSKLQWLKSSHIGLWGENTTTNYTDGEFCFSILEVAVDPSYAIFFQRTWQQRPFWCQYMPWIAIGCILVLQAVRL